MVETPEDGKISSFRFSGIYFVLGSEVWKCITLQVELLNNFEVL